MKRVFNANRSLILLAFGLATVTIVVIACSESDDASQIRQLISEAAQCAEDHDMAAILDYTTDEFSAEPGGHERRSIRGVLWWAFKHYGQFRLLYPEPRVELADSGDTAVAGLMFVIIKKGGIIPELDGLYDDPQGWVEELGEAADLYRLELALEKKNGEWGVYHAVLSAYR